MLLITRPVRSYNLILWCTTALVRTEAHSECGEGILQNCWQEDMDWAIPFNNRTPLSRILEFFRSKGYFALEFFRVETISTRNSAGVE